MIRTLASAVDLSFNRIQFTPDLMPADIVGHLEVIQEDKHSERAAAISLTCPDRLFANIVLADEINRTTSQNAGRAPRSDGRSNQVTVGGKTGTLLPNPFFVLATQNPIEHGRYLPAS